jgi:hypothetical protein
MRCPLAALLFLAALAPCHAGAQAGAEPVPIPGGFHFFTPGPLRSGYSGLQVEASTITDFQGEVALAYLSGVARSAEGQNFIVSADMRVFRGDYVAADGVTRRGVFGFV